MYAVIFLSIFFTVSTKDSVVLAATYDQSQSGDLNVQVDLKGLHIIALMKGGKEEYVDYDYAYDYSEMTIKPQNGTTVKPASASTTSNTTYIATNTTVSMIEEPSTLVTTKANSDFAITTTVKDSLGSSPTTDVASSASYLETSTVNYSSESKTTTTTQPIVCKKGFVLNQKGECELRLQNPSTNALLKLVKLSQKLKLRRERGNFAANGNE